MPASSLFSCLPGRARRVAGFCGSGEAFAVAQFLRGEGAPVLFLARDALSAAHLAEEIPFFAPDVSVRLLPDWETLPYDAFAPPAEAVGARVKALSLLLDSAPGITIAAATAALGPFAPPRFVAAHAFELQVGGKVNLLGLAARLSLGGYARVEQVRAPGEFAVRGGQADVFPAGGRKPLRVVLFDDEVEEIRVFNPETQLSESRVESFRALPAREFDFSAEGVKVFQKEFGARFGDERGGGEILDKVRSGEAPPGAEYLIPLFFAEGEAARLFDYLPDNQRILTHDDARDGLESFLHQARLRQKVVSVYEGRPVIPAAELFLSLEDFFLAMKKFGALSLRGEDGCGPPPEVSDTGSVAELARRFSGKLILAADGEGRREMLRSALRAEKIRTANISEFAEAKAGEVSLAVAPLRSGFAWRDESLNEDVIALTESEIFQARLAPRSRRAAAVSASESFRAEEIRAGDLVAHEAHGIGRCLGMKTMKMGGSEGEFLELEYAEGGRLWLPVSQLGNLRRHHGGGVSGKGGEGGEGGKGGEGEGGEGGDGGVALSKLGSSAWRKSRAKAAKRARDTAARLLEIAANRAANSRVRVPVDSAALARFAASFPHPETPDQARAAEEVLADLQSAKPMDRLLAADVGFGKTEVAMRAACAAALRGEQSAILAPTTLLASQHFRNFTDRFAGWPVRVAELTRHATAAQRRDFFDKLARGETDIAVGTHALLGREAKWKNLGLAVIDEEHRFGVRQKERFKEMRADVDILALSATPIPRSLSLSLEGVRDFSVITTPPQSRLPVKTLVAPFSRALTTEACEREMLRGGQVFFVHNETRDLEATAARLEEWLPRARIVSAHGGMRASRVEDAMRKFLRREADVLVCTTIVESGLDIPNANTLVVDRADRMGLSRLHQLRGRVGRSRAQAFAYFLTPPEGAMTRGAEERLAAIASHSELGGGFHLAMRDLEIRGAGEALGERQSGELEAVGYGVFHSLLKRALRDLKRGRKGAGGVSEDVEAVADLGGAALLPSGYVAGVNERLRCYCRLAECASEEDLRAARGELEDRFGRLPAEAELLLEGHRLRLLCARTGAVRIRAAKTGATIEFGESPPVAEALVRKIAAGECGVVGRNGVRLMGLAEDALERARGVGGFLEGLG